jgi:GxxExxY protein
MQELNALTERIIGLAIKVHKALGPGLLESTYEICFAYALEKNGFKVERQKVLPVVYQGISIECGYRIDLMINGKIILELKTIEKFLPVHEAQLLSYLKLSRCKLGLLINFNTKYLKDGIVRLIN